MSSDFLSGIWLGIFLTYAAKTFWATWLKKSQHSKASKTTANEPSKCTTKVDGDSQRWFVVPGERIELGSSGFYIELIPNDEDPPYLGYSPEGFLYGRSRELAAMKDYLEDRARERAEFSPPGAAWKHQAPKNKRHSS